MAKAALIVAAGAGVVGLLVGYALCSMIHGTT